MIPMLLLTVVGGFAFVLLMRLLWAKTQPSKPSTLITVAAAVMIAALLMLAATGRLHWLVAIGAAVFPFLRRIVFSVLPLVRLFPMFRGLFGGVRPGMASGANGSAGGPQTSEALTGELRVTLHHDTGHMDGEILKGRHSGRLLSELTRPELETLLAELQEQESKQLLQAYLTRHFGAGADGGAQGAGDGSERAEDRTGYSDGNMTRGEALEVLGLEDGASKDEIIDAHRRLIQRMHPDRGGSSYLAAKLNEAKRVLIRRK